MSTKVSATATVTEKVIKKKSLLIEAPCSLSGKPIEMVTEQVELGISNPDKKEVISIANIDEEIDYINNYIEKNGSTYASMKKIDSDLTNKLVKNIVSELISQHTTIGEDGDSKKKFSLSQKVLAGFTEWNKALASNTKFEADTDYPLANISQETIKEFVSANSDLVEELGEHFSPTDLYIKSELLATIAWFIENPITDVIDLGEVGTEKILEKYEDYIPLVKKPVGDKKSEKNVASVNIEYNLAYITLSYMISSFDDYTVKRLEGKIKKYFSDYSTDNVKAFAKDNAKLLKLAKSVDNDKVATRLFTLLNNKDELKKLAVNDKKLEEKLNNPEAKWPTELDTNAFAREYTEWALAEDEEYALMHYELEIARQLQEISKRFVVCGNASDISKADGMVDSLVLSLEKKFAEYADFLTGKFEAEPKGRFTDTYCGRKIIVNKKKRYIDPLTDTQLLLGLKPIEDNGKVTQNPQTPCYGSYMRKLYKHAIKAYKFTFAPCEKTFETLFEHIVRDTVNFYTTLAIRSHNKFVSDEIYNLSYDQLSRHYAKADADKLDTFIKKLTSFANGGVVTSDDLPDSVPLVVDLFDSFETDMEPHSVYQPGTSYNLYCPLAHSDLTRHRRDAENFYNIESERYAEILRIEQEKAELEEKRLKALRERGDDSDYSSDSDSDSDSDEDEEQKQDEDEDGDSKEEKKKTTTRKRKTEPKLEKTFKSYYKSNAVKSGNKNTIRFLNDLSMAVAYIVNLRLVWLGKLITFASGEDPYYDTDERKNYVASVIRNQIETVSSSHASNEAFKSCITAFTKELKNRSLEKNNGDIEKDLKEDLRILRTAGRLELNAQEEALRLESERLNTKGKRAVSTKERPWLSAKEKKIYYGTSFHANFILEKAASKKLDSVSHGLFIEKINRLNSYAENLAVESRNPVDVINESHTTMAWAYPVKPYTNNNSVNIINTTLQRTLHLIVEGCLTNQFYSTDNKKKNVVNGEVFKAVLNLYRGNEIW